MKRVLLAGVIACLAAGCGKKGPPLPPLVKLPVAPTDLAANRRGNTVDLTVTVPASNTDGTRPANISRVEILALTAPASTSDTAVLKDGVKVASVQVKTPRDPNDTVDVDDPDSDVEAPQGPGLDQGAVAHLRETLTPQADVPWSPAPVKGARRPVAGKSVPLVGPPVAPPVRLYLAMAFNQHGRRGPVSRRINVPLIPPPPRAPAPSIAYDESAITLTWGDVAAAHEAPASAGERLPSRPLLAPAVKTAYNVYEIASESSDAPGELLTSAPTPDPKFVQPSIVWDKPRCYTVRIVDLVAGMSIEGDRGPASCVTPVDTFPPATPKKPTAIALAGSINILWDANVEPDLAGYLVFRGTAPGGGMTQLTPQPIDRTNYTDEVAAGFRAFYAIEAVDRAGNVSQMSPVTDEETSR